MHWTLQYTGYIVYLKEMHYSSFSLVAWPKHWLTELQNKTTFLSKQKKYAFIYWPHALLRAEYLWEDAEYVPAL